MLQLPFSEAPAFVEIFTPTGSSTLVRTSTILAVNQNNADVVEAAAKQKELEAAPNIVRPGFRPPATSKHRPRH